MRQRNAAQTDLVLLKANLPLAQARALQSEASWLTFVGDVSLSRANGSAQEQSGLFYVYLKLTQPRLMSRREIVRIEKNWARCSGDINAQASRLTKMFESAGASLHATPLFHYVVETDPEEGWFDELSAWYDQEHMPGLASVAGCVHTVRMINQDHAPVSFACYDLTAPEVMGSPAWLAVRHSVWSDKCRPHFTNTRRTMFEIID